MANFRYVFRYVLLGFPSATECSWKLPSAELTSQVLPNAPKSPNTKGHVVVVKNINNVVEDSTKPVNTGFFNATNTSEYTLDTFLDTFR